MCSSLSLRGIFFYFQCEHSPNGTSVPVDALYSLQIPTVKHWLNQQMYYFHLSVMYLIGSDLVLYIDISITEDTLCRTRISYTSCCLRHYNQLNINASRTKWCYILQACLLPINSTVVFHMIAVVQDLSLIHIQMCIRDRGIKFELKSV